VRTDRKVSDPIVVREQSEASGRHIEAPADLTVIKKIEKLKK
jgi:hypothetical protein